MEADYATGHVLPQEIYSIGYGTSVHNRHMGRTAENRAGFFLPHLRPGMSLVDCGCGPGSITLGLARAVAPGQVVGVDVEPRQVERARALALEQGVANVRFEVGSVYDLPFADASCDAAFAHNVLEHLKDPLRAMKEMRRVLKPGGVIGVRDPDFGATLLEPATPLLHEASNLALRVRELNGSSLYYARSQRRLLLEAGFARAEGFAFAEYDGSVEATSADADVLAEVLRNPLTVAAAVEQGWADEARLEALVAELRAWGQRPDAFRALVDCAAVGWV